MNRIAIGAIGVAFVFFSSILHAQVPQIVNYQGRVVVGTTNFDGSGQFKFALVNAAGTTTFWSNDNTSTAGSEPTAAVALTVTKGLYSVLLGDAALANMTAVPATVFTNGDVRLRVWFNDGTNGSQLLTPDQRVAAVGYALVAEEVSLPSTTNSTTGVIRQNGSRLLHTFGGNGNFFAGPFAGNFTTSSTFNTGIGQSTLSANTSGFSNTAIGFIALGSNTTGGLNTALGVAAGSQLTTGSNNIALGNSAGSNLTTGSNNIDIGNFGVAGESNIIRIGTSGTQTDTFLTGVIHGDGSALTGVPGFTGSLAGDVTGPQGATVVSIVGGVTAANVASGANLANAATSANTASTIVRRDASGNFGGGLTGNAATATALQTGRIINGILFDGTSNITVTAAASTLTGSTLASGVIGSSLTSLGTLTSLTTSGAILAPAGSAAAPSHTFSGDTNTGIFRSAADTLNFATNGVSRMSISSTGVISGDGSGLTGVPAFTGSLAGDVTGSQSATVVSTVGGVTAANVASGANLANAATSTNTASSIVRRDASGNFSAGTITAGLTGNVIGNASGSAASFTGSLAGNVTGPQGATVVSTVGGVTAANVAAGANLANAATSTNTASSIVRRDASGNFSATTITVDSRINLPVTTSSSVGLISQNGSRLLHTFGTANFFAGPGAGNFSVTGASNTATGDSALATNTTGDENTASGGDALRNNSAGTGNTATGFNALSNATGSFNIAIGHGAGASLTTGAANIAIGNSGVAAESSTIRIGASQTRAFIAGIRGITTGVNNASAVLIDSNGQLGTVSSSRRYKEDIADMGDASARLQALRPVAFRYKKPYADGGKPMQYGLIAEEVAEAFPELAVFNDEGQPETVKYHDLTPLLLNEFLKERKRATEMEAALREENASLKKRFAELEAKDKEREARLVRLEQFNPVIAESGAAKAAFED